MGIYSQVELTHREVSKARKESFYLLYSQFRLGHIIPKIEIASHSDRYWFYTSTEEDNPSLVFVYDNDVDGNPLFADRVLGKLYVDSQQRLILATWPLPKRNFTQSPPMRKEVLLEGVVRLEFRFYQPPRRDVGEKQIDLEDTAFYNDWHPTWLVDRDKIPAIITIDVEVDNISKRIVMDFVLPKTEDTIIYQQ